MECLCRKGHSQCSCFLTRDPCQAVFNPADHALGLNSSTFLKFSHGLTHTLASYSLGLLASVTSITRWYMVPCTTCLWADTTLEKVIFSKLFCKNTKHRHTHHYYTMIHNFERPQKQKLPEISWRPPSPNYFPKNAKHRHPHHHYTMVHNPEDQT